MTFCSNWMLFVWSYKIHLGLWQDPAVSMCAVCSLAGHGLAEWQGSHILTDGPGWGCPVGSLREPEGGASNLPMPGTRLESSARLVQTFSFSFTLTVAKGNRLKVFPTVSKGGEKKWPAVSRGKSTSRPLASSRLITACLPVRWPRPAATLS